MKQTQAAFAGPQASYLHGWSSWLLGAAIPAQEYQQLSWAETVEMSPPPARRRASVASAGRIKGAPRHYVMAFGHP